MKHFGLVAITILAVTGCKRGARWKEHKITTVEVGSFAAPIPEGWRDFREFFETVAIPAGARAVMPEESEASLGFQANIIVMWLPVDATWAQPCVQLADVSSKAQGATRTGEAPESKIGDDRVCMWTSTNPKAANTTRIRYHGDHVLFVQCLRAVAGDAVGDAGCTAFWGSLIAKP